MTQGSECIAELQLTHDVRPRTEVQFIYTLVYASKIKLQKDTSQ
jgi:hypothetical protein